MYNICPIDGLAFVTGWSVGGEEQGSNQIVGIYYYFARVPYSITML